MTVHVLLFARARDLAGQPRVEVSLENDATVADLENVFLYNLDDLAKIAEQNRAAREAEIGKCRAFSAERATSLWRQVEGRLQGGNPSAGFPQVKVEG